MFTHAGTEDPDDGGQQSQTGKSEDREDLLGT